MLTQLRRREAAGRDSSGPFCAMAGQGLSVRGGVQTGRKSVFLSTFEKQLDSKRRTVVPHDFRAAVAGPFDGVFCFPSIEADCIDKEGGVCLFVCLDDIDCEFLRPDWICRDENLR